MMYQRSVLRHRVIPLSQRPSGVPTPLHRRFLTKPQWSPIWITACVLVLLLLGVTIAMPR
jgi:hypothetical protein